MYALNHTLPIRDMKIIENFVKLKFLHHLILFTKFNLSWMQYLELSHTPLY